MRIDCARNAHGLFAGTAGFCGLLLTALTGIAADALPGVKPLASAGEGWWVAPLVAGSMLVVFAMLGGFWFRHRRRGRRDGLTESEWQLRAEQAERRAAQAETAVRAGLLPYLARLLHSKFLLRLLSQRAQLVTTQQASTERVEDLEQRLARTHTHLSQRLQTYEERIHRLQSRVARQPNSPHPPTPLPEQPSQPLNPAPRKNPFSSQASPIQVERLQFVDIMERKKRPDAELD